MSRATAAAAKVQAKVLRALADEVEAGRRRLSPALSRALADEIDAKSGDISAEEWDHAWGTEIDRRLKPTEPGSQSDATSASSLSAFAPGRARLLRRVP
jgi:hypothetical protein